MSPKNLLKEIHKKNNGLLLLFFSCFEGSQEYHISKGLYITYTWKKIIRGPPMVCIILTEADNLEEITMILLADVRQIW